MLRLFERNGVWGVMLALVALYLVLERGTSAGNVIRAGASGWSQVLRTLQGR